MNRGLLPYFNPNTEKEILNGIRNVSALDIEDLDECLTFILPDYLRSPVKNYLESNNVNEPREAMDLLKKKLSSECYEKDRLYTLRNILRSIGWYYSGVSKFLEQSGIEEKIPLYRKGTRIFVVGEYFSDIQEAVEKIREGERKSKITYPLLDDDVPCLSLNQEVARKLRTSSSKLTNIVLKDPKLRKMIYLRDSRERVVKEGELEKFIKAAEKHLSPT